MSSLRERLEARGLEESTLTIRGERFRVVELDKGDRLDLLAACRDGKGLIDNRKLENVFLSACVKDPDSGETVYGQDESHLWDHRGAGFTGPLMAEIMRLNGLDNDDVGREVKKSEPAGSSE